MGTSTEKLPPPPGRRPFLVYSHGEDMEDHTIISFSDQVRSHVLQIPELQQKHFWAACSSGWCLFSDNSSGGAFFLWNSLMLAKIRLPYLHIDEQGLECILFGSPESPDFKVLLFSRISPLITLCHVGAPQWRVIDYTPEFFRCFGDEDIEEGFIRLGEPIGYNGKLYFLSILSARKSFTIEGFDSDSVVLEVMDVDHLVIPPYATSHFSENVVELDGVIYSVFAHFGVDDEEVIAVEVHRFDLPGMRWVKVENVPHLAFFLVDNGSFCCRASVPGIKGNCVYLFMNNDDVHVYEYGIGDVTLIVHRPVIDEDLPHSSPFWIMCDQRLINQSEEIKNGKIVSKQGHINVHARGKESQWNSILLEEADVEKMKNCDLRADVAQSLGQYLSPVDYLQFRATCRTCQSVSPLDKFKESLLSTLKSGDSPSPLLVFLESGNLAAFVDPIRGDKYLITLPPQLSGRIITYSKDGYLLMSGHGLNGVYFFNPFARKLLPFTQTQVVEYETYCAGFSSSPTSNYSIVTASKHIDEVFVITFAQSGGQECTYYRFAFAYDTGFSFCDNSPVFHNGAFHFLGEDGYLAVLLPEGNSFTWEVHKPTKLRSSYSQKFLLECEGKLVAVFASYFLKRVRVYRWDQFTSKWSRVRNLGKHMIYVSNSSSLSMIASVPGMENKVYFPRFCGQSIVFYSLATERFHTFKSKDFEIDVYDTRERLQSCWIDPIWT